MAPQRRTPAQPGQAPVSPDDQPPTPDAPRTLRVLERLENPDGGVWEADTIIPFDALPPESITLLMERQIVMVYLAPEQIDALPIE